MTAGWPPRGCLVGATYEGGQQCCFRLWAPKVAKVEVHLLSPNERIIPLKPIGLGYHEAHVEGVEPGATYYYRLDGKAERPDPASRFQPNGVHGPSEIVATEFQWTDRAWFGLLLRDYILYELHVGTFTREGTFEAIIPHLADLRDLGVTAIELMPVGQFPGSRNWGYDGVFPFAVQHSYGGPVGLQRLVNACHEVGLAVVLDVVYNHLGPEGNYLAEFGHYFDERYRTPWGAALNFDGEYCDEVRRFFLENALYWQTEFHIDALRLDAIHAIKDWSAMPFLRELAEVTHRGAEELNRRFHLIAESDLNDARVISPEAADGLGLDAQWSDDFHHCLHVLLTGEKSGYYADFEGVGMLAKVFRNGFAYTGQYSRFRRRRHGNLPRRNSARQFVVCSQNHDQIGNRCAGERLSALVSFESLKLAAGAVLLSPFIPLLFMGEEYGESAPFQYVISHTSPELVEAVRQARTKEFSGFDWRGEVPDPAGEATFQRCVLQRQLCRTENSHQVLYRFYRELIRLRKDTAAIISAELGSLETQAFERQAVLSVLYPLANRAIVLVLCFSNQPALVTLEIPTGNWRRILDSANPTWGGPGSSVPERFKSSGCTELQLNPVSLLVFQQTG